MDSELIMPLVVLWIVWVVAASNIRSHFRNRAMTANPPSGGSFDSDGPRSYSTTPSDHPISYWALLAFYWLTAVFVPAATAYVLL